MTGLTLRRPGTEVAVRLAEDGKALDAWAFFRTPDVQIRRECEAIQSAPGLDELDEDGPEYLSEVMRRGLAMVAKVFLRFEGVFSDEAQAEPLVAELGPDGTFDAAFVDSVLPMANLLIESATRLLSLGSVEDAKNLPSPPASREGS